MVFHQNHSITSSESQTPPLPPPPTPAIQPPPPLPPPSPAMRMATSSSAGAFPSKLHQNLTFRWPLNSSSSHLSNNPSRFRYGRFPLPEAGGLNPILRIGPSPLNPARSSNNINTNQPVAGPVVGPVEGSERKVDEKGKSKLFIRLPMKKRGLGPGYVPSFTEPEPEAEAESEPEAEGEGDDGDVEVKTWNLRPRRPPVAVAKAKDPN